ncbi:hypothetical protein JCM21900_000084 [Sporobolomyces salmonicolor]
MATLERPRDSTSTRTALDSNTTTSSFAPAAVPSPFPERGRSHLPISQQADRNDSASRSPGGTKRSLSKVVDKMKRAMSSSREPSYDAAERGRRGSADTSMTDEPRGRSPFSAFSPRSVSASRGRTGSAIGMSTHPLTTTNTRSSSRGRSIATSNKVLSTGRGGAGNLIGVTTGEDITEFDGEEDPDVVRAVREERSRSREREGRFEIATSGRGGRGNIRSQSRNRDLELGRVPTVLEEQERMEVEDEELREEELKKKIERQGPERWVSSGRGGAGNIFNARQVNRDRT